MKQIITSSVLAMALLAGCNNASDDKAPATHQGESTAAKQGANPWNLAGHIVAAEANTLLGDQQGTREHVQAMQQDMMRTMRMPDPTRPIEHELALAKIRKLTGAISAMWVDQRNVLVLVDNASYRTMETIDRVCAALDPLGDTLAVVVHVQNVHAKTPAAAESISRNCQLPPGENALMQVRRRIDVVDPDIRRAFEAQQSGAQH